MKLKFRAWVNGTKSMHEVKFINLVSERVQLNDNKRYWYFSADFKLMQFTGLYDGTSWNELSETEQSEWLTSGHYSQSWHGKEIYEGDILESDNENFATGVVVYDDGRFAIKKPNGKIIAYDHTIWTACEVIGNIYENPELLEEKQ